MTRIPATLLLSLSLAVPAMAGVVFEVETTRNEQVETHEMAAQGKKLTMALPTGVHDSESEVIYDGELRQVMFLDHGNMDYMVFDQAMIEQIAGIATQMQQMLKNVPESQRGAVEQMMKQNMPDEAGPASLSKLKIENTGEKAAKAGYPCVKYVVTRDGVMIAELWVTDWSNVEGGKEIMGVFKDMGDFVREMMESVSAGLGPMAGQLDQGFLGLMSDIDGFPVVTRQFEDDGSLDSESILRSARRQKLDPAEFEPPSGYKRRQMLQ